MNQSELAIVLKTVAYEDRHRIITAISENHGKITAMAKNAIGSRRFGANLEPFSAAIWKWTDKRDFTVAGENRMLFLESCEPKRSFEGIRLSFESLSIASIASELVIKTAPAWTPCPELFKLHANFLALVDENPKASVHVQLTLVLGLMIKILHFHGLNPRLTECQLFALIEDAGFSCCERPRNSIRLDLSFLEISPIALKTLATLFQNPIRKALDLGLMLEQVPLAPLTEALQYLKLMLHFHLATLGQTEIKSLQIFEGILPHAKKIQEDPGRPSRYSALDSELETF